MEKEYIESLTLLRMSDFENKAFYIFINEKGEYRSLEFDKFNIHLEPGAVVQAKMYKKGCAGREITELLFR